MKEHSPLFLRSVAVIKAIPEGKILTYSGVANLISAPGCARHVSFILSSSSKKYKLPWHRVINSQGRISLNLNNGYHIQKRRLQKENIEFINEKIDLNEHEWKPTKTLLKKILKGLPRHIPYSERT